MSTSVPTASNNNSTKPPIVPSSSIQSAPAPSCSSNFTVEQWMDILRALPASSLLNLQFALKQFLVDQKAPLPDASTLVRTSLPQDDMPQNTYGKDRFDVILRNHFEIDRKPPTLDAPNGLDALAAAALASTNAETNVTSTPPVALFQGKTVSGASMVAIPITSPVAPALLGGFKTDSSQRQSPTIRETPKRLAATRAEAEQAAAAQGGGSNDSVKRSRLDGSAVDDDDGTTPGAISQIVTTTGNLLLSNGALGATSLKPDPEQVNTNYTFQSNTQDMASNWNLPQPTSSNPPGSTSSGMVAAENRRRARDEGITDDEAARREKRRERNRVAAAKCRQNRQNQIEDLKARKKLLEDESVQIKQKLDVFKQQKLQFEDLIKNHARNGCPFASQYYQDGSIVLPLNVASAAVAAAVRSSGVTTIQTSSAAPAGVRIVQTGNTHQLLTNSVMPTNAMIKPEAPSSSPPLTFVPAQRPNTLSLVMPNKTELPTPSLDSATASVAASQLATHLWSPSVAAKIKTPGGESWVNSQIGLPPITGGGADKDVNPTNSAVTTTTAILSTPDILHHLGINVGKTSSIQIGGGSSTDEKNSDPAVSVGANVSSATASENIS